jgi:hypothetical protein
VARSGLVERADASAVLHVDPTLTSSAGFLQRLEQLDRLVYSPAGMVTPRWALYDCAELPGAVFGLCTEAGRLPDPARTAIGASGADAVVPINAVVSIPTVESDHWLVYAVCGLSERAPTGFADLRRDTLAAALAWLGASRVTAVCQWDGDRVALHLACGVLSLRAAWMASHDQPATCCFDYALDRAAAPFSEDRTWIPARDEPALRRLQTALEAGDRFQIVETRAGTGGPEYGLSRRNRG